MLTTSTLTEAQWELRERTVEAIRPAADTFRQELRDGTPRRDVVAVADDLCPGAGEDWAR